MRIPPAVEARGPLPEEMTLEEDARWFWEGWREDGTPLPDLSGLPDWELEIVSEIFGPRMEYTDEAEIDLSDHWHAQPRDRRGRWVDGAQRFGLGLTPFRPDDNPEGFFESEKFRRFEREPAAAARRHRVSIDRKERVSGFWQGDQEPSLAVEAHDGPDGVAAMAEEVRAAFDQDGVLFFQNDPDGRDIAYTVTSPNGGAAEALQAAGIDGATIYDGKVVIYGDADTEEQVLRLQGLLGGEVKLKAGVFRLAERQVIVSRMSALDDLAKKHGWKVEQPPKGSAAIVYTPAPPKK